MTNEQLAQKLEELQGYVLEALEHVVCLHNAFHGIEGEALAEEE